MVSGGGRAERAIFDEEEEGHECRAMVPYRAGSMKNTSARSVPSPLSGLLCFSSPALGKGELDGASGRCLALPPSLSENGGSVDLADNDCMLPVNGSRILKPGTKAAKSPEIPVEVFPIIFQVSLRGGSRNVAYRRRRGTRAIPSMR